MSMTLIHHRRPSGLAAIIVCVFALLSPCAFAQSSQPSTDWREAEKGILADWVQLTFSDRFIKAGESYFSPDNSKIIFQAVEKPEAGKAADDFYGMYVADVVYDPVTGRLAAIERIKRISPEGSANTCGWFHPTRPNIVIFSTTLARPVDEETPGFQRSGLYKWMFPKEMRIVECDLNTADGTAATLTTLVGDGTAYVAEGSICPEGRRLLYCSLESGEGDLFIKDLKTNRTTRIVQARGYDGGPFFSPDGKRICYRSDRDGDSMLQLYVADLAFNDTGEVVGISREYQVTDESCVNWCPFWTRDGRRLVYASSLLGEQNFEVYLIDADPGDLPGSNGTIRYGTGKRRITHFDNAGGPPASDILPAFSSDGRWMIFTSRRCEDRSVQLWAARFVLDPDAPWKKSPAATPASRPPAAAMAQDENRIKVRDPDNGRIFIYDMTQHVLSEYDPRTHKLSPIETAEDIERFRELYRLQQGGGDE